MHSVGTFIGFNTDIIRPFQVLIRRPNSSVLCLFALLVNIIISQVSARDKGMLFECSDKPGDEYAYVFGHLDRKGVLMARRKIGFAGHLRTNLQIDSHGAVACQTGLLVTCKPLDRAVAFQVELLMICKTKMKERVTIRWSTTKTKPTNPRTRRL